MEKLFSDACTINPSETVHFDSCLSEKKTTGFIVWAFVSPQKIFLRSTIMCRRKELRLFREKKIGHLTK